MFRGTAAATARTHHVGHYPNSGSTGSAPIAEVVRRHINAYNRRDLKALRALSHPDLQLDWTASRWVNSGVYRGIDAVLRFYQDYFETFEEVIIEPESFVVAGQSVVIPNTARMRGREGIQVVARSTLGITVAGGKVSCIRLYQTVA